MKNPFLKAKGQTTHLYTKGKEFTVGLTEYIGYYHLNGKTPFSGPIHNGFSKKLEAYNSSPGILIYNQLKPENKILSTFIEPYATPVSPTDAQYNSGMFTRYFLAKRNTFLNIIYEVNSDMVAKYGKEKGIDNNLYQLTKMQWAITKNSKLKLQVQADNAINLRIANNDMRGLSNIITSLYEYSFEVI